MYLLTITLGKILNRVIALFKLGAGFTWPGHLILKLYPTILQDNRLLPKKGLIFVSATNGKTTTAKMLSHVLVKSGFKVVSNTSGANLLNGVTAALVLDTDTFGVVRADFGVFEVDEFVLPSLLNFITPNVLLLLNLSRDQLDRYGETDIILGRWEKSLAKLPANTKLILDAGQAKLLHLSTIFKGTTEFFDAQSTPSGSDLKGEFNTRNLNAAILALVRFGISKEFVLNAMKDFIPAWGRAEVVEHNGFNWRILLAKNPMSFNNNLESINKSEFSEKTLLFVLNDNIPDGRDVSWIYDVAAEKLVSAAHGKNVFIAGSRAFDMAVRLKYSGVEVSPENIFSSVSAAVGEIEKPTDTKEVLVLPNYSAMLEVRKVLTGRSIL